MRHIWPADHTVADFFDSPSFGMLWLGSDKEWVWELSKEQACKILNLTASEFFAMEIEAARRAFFPGA